MSATLGTFDLAETTQLWRHAIDARLAAYTDYGSDTPIQLAEAIRHSLLAPGKRLRPMLVLMACEACGYDHEAALPAACAVEMIHTYSLIHDDLPAMDDDDMRRGQPSCHAKYGEATAILAGDALLAQAFEVVATDVQPPEVAARCCGELAKAAGPDQLVGGQQDDLAAQFGEPNLEQLERIHRRKTGAMINVSLRLGGLVAQASEEQLAALDAYGGRLGLAFQIVDDLLDCEGTAENLGKRTGKDADRGKMTFPAVLGLEESRRRAKELVAAAIDAAGRFGPRGAGLAALARYVEERNH
ncbi:MAG: polyprenyl synthetase family protein [Pirellulaceae bacterium]|jgi:geranylgeranyl diphosphate synthase type II|nr:polyprenyl synthetase family protein [Pirellulaceae bacterium]